MEMRQRFCSLLFLIVSCVAGFSASSAADETLVIRGGTIVDPARPGGVDAGSSSPAVIVIQQGVISSVGPASVVPIPDRARVIDAQGLYVMPGLADMHNHLRTGTFLPGDDQAGILRSLLEWGVTTTFDPGVPAEHFEALLAAIEESPASYPRAFLIKGVFTTEGGWGKGYRPATASNARAIVRQLKSAGSAGVKLMYDDMRWATTRPFPIMDRAIMTAIIDEAHLQGMQAFAHAPILELAKQVVEGGIDCLLHGIISEPVDEEFTALMRNTGTCYISTLSMFGTNAGYSEWADKLAAFDLDNRHDEKALDLFHKVPTGTARLDNTMWAAERLPILASNLLMMQRAGIPIVIGTDTGIPGVMPGIATQMEIVMHVDAGLTVTEALLAATRNAARMMGQEGVFGGIAVGMAADLLILEADPRADIGNIRRIRHVVRAGRVIPGRED
jgi:imidazolonepropionase-like amidohydrolase